MAGSGRRLLVFGSYDAALHPRVAVLRDGLALRGWQVAELNVPLEASTADKVAAAGSPGAAVRLAARQVRSWALLAARSRGTGRPDAVLVGYLGHADVHLARLRYPRSVIALDHMVGLADTVRDRGLGGRIRLRLLDLADRAALRAADIVVVDTDQQAQLLPEPLRAKGVLVPVGAGRAWFDAGRAEVRRGEARRSESGVAQSGVAVSGGVVSGGALAGGAVAVGAQAGRAESAGAAVGSSAPIERGRDEGVSAALRVIFVGLFTPLQGAPTIGRAIDLLRHEAIDFTLVGHGQDLAATRSLARGSDHVRWLDWVGADELPDLVAGHDVALGIFGTGSKAQRVVPTKVYQGLAAGCAVVTAATPAAGTLGDAVVSVPPGDPEALAAALRHLAADKESLTVARNRARAAAGQFASESATRALDERLALAVARRGALPPLTFNAHLRWDVITRELDGLDIVDVLEIGPGEGAVACRLAPGRTYTGVELSERTRAITEQRLIRLGSPGRLVASLDDLPADERFDLVCAFEVIEHIDRDREAMAAWAARVRPGGTLLISTPAGPHRMAAADEIAGHFRRYWADGLAAMARDCGLVDVRVTHVGHPVGYALEWVRNTVAAKRLGRGSRGLRGARSPGDGAHAAPAHGTPTSGSGVSIGTASGVAASGLAADDLVADDLVAMATEQSSSFLQPPPWSGRLTQAVSVPGIWAQRRRPDAGTGLVLAARAPK